MEKEKFRITAYSQNRIEQKAKNSISKFKVETNETTEIKKIRELFGKSF